jgi:predicted dehydrogenase
MRLADAQNRHIVVGHTFLFSHRVERIRDYLTAGRLGKVQYVTSSRLNLGLHQSDISVIWDLAPHDFSIIFHILGESPISVSTSGRAVVRTGSPDVAFMNLSFPSGVVASVSVSWLAPSKARNTIVVGDEQMLVYDDCDNEQPLKLYDKGIVLSEPPGNFGEHQLTYRVGDMLAPHVPSREPLAREIEHFVACCNGFPPPVSDSRFGLSVVTALEAAERSWQLGGVPVDVAEARPRLEPELVVA